MLYKEKTWKVTKNYEVYEVLKWHHLPSNRLSLRDSARRLWGQWWWGWLRLWRTWLLFRLLVQSFYNAGCLCHGRRWCWSKHIYGRKSDSEMELIFYLPSCFSGLHLHVLLLQDLPPSKTNALLHVVNKLNRKQSSFHWKKDLFGKRFTFCFT